MKIVVHKSTNNLSLPIPQNYEQNYDFFVLQPKQCDDNVEANTSYKTLVTPPRRSTNKKRPPTYLVDFQTTNVVCEFQISHKTFSFS